MRHLRELKKNLIIQSHYAKNSTQYLSRVSSIFAFLLIFTSGRTYAQFNQGSFENRIRPDSLAAGELHFNLYNFNYVRNYEYFNGFQDGYTLYGIQLEPQLVYHAHPNLAITAGAYLRKDFGDNGFHDAKPLISLKYQKRTTSLIFGSLEGNIHHRYIEPVYDLERKITTPVEYGTQLLVEKENFFLDAWISWEQMIYKPSPVQERIAGGVSAEAVLSGKDGWKLSVPVQFLALHRGGQIDIGNTPLTTILNGSAGIKLRKTFSGSNGVKDFFTENYIAVYKDFSPLKQLAFQSGSGYWLNAGLTTTFGTFLTSYWHGNGFISIKGMPLFQSVSQQINHPAYAEKKRSILMFRYAYQKQLIPRLYLDIRLEPLVDLASPISNKIDFSNSFFLTFKENFRVGKIHK